MKQAVLQNLQATLIGDNVKLSQANDALYQLSQQTGYCITLMEIVDEPQLVFPVKQAALIQLKNIIKSRWKLKNNQSPQINQGEKASIKSSLITAVIRCSKAHMLIKLYKEIISIVMNNEFENWVPIEEILTKLQNSQDIIAVFHCILGICSNFQHSIYDKERMYFTQFLFSILPAVLATVQQNMSNPEVIYLSVKILYKSIHYDIPPEIKKLTNDWMQLLLIIISSYNQNFKPDDFQQRNSQQFFYFHSKKWATRIIMRYVQKHAKQNHFGFTPNNKEYSQFWYQNYAATFIEAIVQQFAIPTIKKVRYFQLKTIQGWINDKPMLIGSFANKFQYEILPSYMMVTPEDDKLATNDVIQYLRNEEEPGINFTNTKRAATEVWTGFFSIGSKNDQTANIYKPGPMFEDNFKFLLAKLESDNLVEKDLAMYLFCELRINLNKVPEVKAMIPQLLDKYVIPEFRNSAILIRARANDMFYEYGKSIEDIAIVNKAAEGIYMCMSEDPAPLVRIKAAVAFHPILYHSDTKELVKPILKNILEIYLKLIDLYDLEQIVSALQFIIADFSSQIGPMAIQLFKYLSGVFVKMFNKDVEQNLNDDYGGQIFLAASACLKTMSQIIQSPLQIEVRRKLEQNILEVLGFIFSNQSVEYTEEVMYMLNVHIYKIDKISAELWFFYQVIIYFLMGIPEELWAQIDQLPMPASHKNILLNNKSSRNTDYLEQSFPVIRNFISKGMQMILNQKQEFRHNFIQMFFYLITSIYKVNLKKNGSIECEVQLNSAAILLVYLIETFPSEFNKPFVTSIWNYIKFNFHKAESYYLKQINVQLLFVAFWKNPVQMHQLCAITQEKYLPQLIKFSLQRIPKFKDVHERKRVILGICSLLMLPEQSQALQNQLVSLFKCAMNLIQKNCRARVIMSLQAQNRKEQILKMLQEEQEQDMDENNEEDDEDFWDEDYDTRFESTLAKTDEIEYFKNTMNWLQNNNSNIYQGLIASVQQQTLVELNNKMQEYFNGKTG